MPKETDEIELPLRITLVRPPASVFFCLQRGKDELVDRKESTGEDLSFELTVRVAGSIANGAPRFLGPFTQGPADARFIYIRSGTAAGQKNTAWTRRAKVHLAGLSWDLIKKVRGQARIEARFAGTAKDGGPSCASVPLLDGGWRIQ